VLLSENCDAFWVTLAPFAEYVRHEWAGAWTCTAFRNEGSTLSSDLIIDAVSATRWKFGEPPDHGFITFVNTAKTKSVNPGYCYKKAGWRQIGKTKGGLVALQLALSDMPPSRAPHNRQPSFDF
jgi:hypothetical protein